MQLVQMGNSGAKYGPHGFDKVLAILGLCPGLPGLLATCQDMDHGKRTSSWAVQPCIALNRSLCTSSMPIQNWPNTSCRVLSLVGLSGAYPDLVIIAHARLRPESIWRLLPPIEFLVSGIRSGTRGLRAKTRPSSGVGLEFASVHHRRFKRRCRCSSCTAQRPSLSRSAGHRRLSPARS